MSFSAWLAQSRLRIEEELSGSELRWKFSPFLYVVAAATIPLLRKEARGRVLDVGCGRMPFHPYVAGQVQAYDGLDVERRSPLTRYLSDAQDMREIESASYDTVFSMSALEHMPKPWQAVREMRRVCKPGGTVILLVPFVARLHEEPHDYFRFSAYGLRSMAEDAGLEVQRLDPVGGLFGFLGHQVSTILVCMGWRVPVLRWVLFWLNYVLVVWPCVLLDRLLHTDGKLPTAVLGVFRAPAVDRSDR